MSNQILIEPCSEEQSLSLHLLQVKALVVALQVTPTTSPCSEASSGSGWFTLVLSQIEFLYK